MKPGGKLTPCTDVMLNDVNHSWEAGVCRRTLQKHLMVFPKMQSGWDRRSQRCLGGDMVATQCRAAPKVVEGERL